MKHFTKGMTAWMILIFLNGCSKSNINLTPLSSLEIVNAVIGSPGAQLNSNPNTIGYSSYGQFGLLAGNSLIFVYPTSDSTQPYYNNTVQTVNGGIYSLYLSGVITINTILIKDTILSYPDSSCGIRFINLSPDSNPVSVDIAGLSNGSEVGSLPYKSITAFKKYSANSANTSYTFEIRDAASGTLLTTYMQTSPTFRNITIAFNGLESDQSFGAFTVNNF